MRTHSLKIWPQFLDEVEARRKTFDIRSIKDRVFQAGDQLALRAFDPVRNEYISSRPTVTVMVTAVYSHVPGLEPGYVALSIAL